MYIHLAEALIHHSSALENTFECFASHATLILLIFLAETPSEYTTQQLHTHTRRQSAIENAAIGEESRQEVNIQ